MINGSTRGFALVAFSSVLAPTLACDSSTGPNSPSDPRWSGPARRVTLVRTFELANGSASQPITVSFDTPDISVSGNVVEAERSTSLPVREVSSATNGMGRVAFDIQIPPGGEVELRLTWELTLRQYDALAFQGPAPSLSPGDEAAYLEASERIESTNPSIQEAAEDVTSGLGTELEEVRAIVAFVREHLTYEVQPEARGAFWALENGRGDCTEYATLGVAMARAVGIPARVTGVENMVAPSGTSTYDNHNAAEFWVAGFGWVPVDINYSQSSVGIHPVRSVVLRWGLFTTRDRDSHSTSWSVWRTVSGPTGQLQVRSMEHRWADG